MFSDVPLGTLEMLESDFPYSNREESYYNECRLGGAWFPIENIDERYARIGHLAYEY